jgi:hypothetical protein
VDVALLGGDLVAQPAEFTIVVVGFFAHAFATRRAKPLVSCASRIASHYRATCPLRWARWTIGHHYA